MTPPLLKKDRLKIYIQMMKFVEELFDDDQHQLSQEHVITDDNDEYSSSENDEDNADYLKIEQFTRIHEFVLDFFQ